MHELVQTLINKVGISPEQAEKTLQTVKEYVVTKFPMLEGAVENMFGATTATTLQPAAIDPTIPATPAAPAADHSILDKISDVIPGQTGEKIEEFAKNAAHKAHDAFDNVKEKLGGMFGGDDKK